MPPMPKVQEVSGWRECHAKQQAVMKTGTSTVGITFKGGVVVGADHRATMGHFIANKSVQSSSNRDNLALTTAGTNWPRSIAFCEHWLLVALFELRRRQPMTVKGAARSRTSSLGAHIGSNSIVGVDDDGGHVYSIDSAGGSIPDAYCAGLWVPLHVRCLGGRLQGKHDSGGGLKTAARALHASGQRDAASGNGMDLAIITPGSGYQQVSQDEIAKLLSEAPIPRGFAALHLRVCCGPC